MQCLKVLPCGVWKKELTPNQLIDAAASQGALTEEVLKIFPKPLGTILSEGINEGIKATEKVY